MSRLLFLALLLLLPVVANAADPEPGDACGKEGETVMVPCGSLTCVSGKYVATMIGPSCNVGTPCWARTDIAAKPDKWGMVCRDGKLARAGATTCVPNKALWLDPDKSTVMICDHGSVRTATNKELEALAGHSTARVLSKAEAREALLREAPALTEGAVFNGSGCLYVAKKHRETWVLRQVKADGRSVCAPQRN